MTSTPLYNQKGFGLRQAIQESLQADYHSELLAEVRAGGHKLRRGRLELRLAAHFGFCYGVDRAVDLAYETRRHFPERTLYLTNEMIHNPYVNRRLRELGVRFFGQGYGASDVTPRDVVILPAFGVTSEELAELKAKGCILVDTTCGSVMNVWRRVRQYVGDRRTVLIHGKFAHEETLATSSRARAEGNHYLVMLDFAQAQQVADYVGGRPNAAPPASLQEAFRGATSPGFSFARDLERIGLANQTTMLSSESEAIALLLKAAYQERYGPEELDERFRSFDTICSATQDLQDAAQAMGREGGLSLILVVGGYNSSNTGHLLEISEGFCPAYHIDSPEELCSIDELSHQPLGATGPSRTRGWLPAGEVVIGITAGASTPDRTVGLVMERLLQLCGEGDPLPTETRLPLAEG